MEGRTNYAEKLIRERLREQLLNSGNFVKRVKAPKKEVKTMTSVYRTPVTQMAVKKTYVNNTPQG